MIFIDFSATVIESIIFTSFIFLYFKIKSIPKFVLLVILWTTENYIINAFSISNNFLIICSLVNNIFFLCLEFKKVRFSFFSVPLLVLATLLISNSLSLSLVSFSNNTSVINISQKNSYLINTVVLSRTLFMFSSILLFQLLKKRETSTKIDEWWLLIIFMLNIFLIFNTLLSSIVLNKLYMNQVYILLIELTVLTILSLFIYQKIQKQNTQNLILSKQLIAKEYRDKMYDIINKTSDQIKRDKHRMLYTLIKINQLNKSKNNTELQLFIDNEINKCLNYKYILSTNNPLFDYEYTSAINVLLSRNIDVKSIILIKHSYDILYKEDFINYLISTIKSVAITDSIEITFKEIQSNLILKLEVYFPNTKDLTVINIKSNPYIKKYKSTIRKNCVEYTFLLNTVSIPN